MADILHPNLDAVNILLGSRLRYTELVSCKYKVFDIIIIRPIFFLSVASSWIHLTMPHNHEGTSPTGLSEAHM